MKNAIIGTFIAIFMLTVSQPLLEVFNVLTEKVELGAAILNSCRAARNNALMHSYYDTGNESKSIGDLNSTIDKDKFWEFFVEALSETLGLDEPTTGSNRFGGDGRWNWIEVDIDWIDDTTYGDRTDYDELDGRTISTALVTLETPYKFKTGLLSRLFTGDSHGYNITEERTFIVHIVN